jgi:2-keto-3-deoxy-L-fuconate dehydrogenase
VIDLTGKKAVVTAAADGIGRATALAYAKAGASVVATDIAMDRLLELSGTSGITVAPLDVRDSDAIAALAKAHPDTDILVSCAGYVHHGGLLDTPEADWDFSFDLNIRSAYLLMRAFLPPMLTRGAGAIVAISSVASSIIGVPNRCAYGASKAALIGLIKSVSADYMAKGIRANAICPGTVDSPSLKQRIAAQGDYDTVRKSFVSRQPMGRLGTPEEVADLAVYLGSDAAGFITGQAMVIDGGWTVM